MMNDDGDRDYGSDFPISEQFSDALGTKMAQKSDERIAVAVMVDRVWLPGLFF